MNDIDIESLRLERERNRFHTQQMRKAEWLRHADQKLASDWFVADVMVIGTMLACAAALCWAVFK